MSLFQAADRVAARGGPRTGRAGIVQVGLVLDRAEGSRQRGPRAVHHLAADFGIRESPGDDEPRAPELGDFVGGKPLGRPTSRGCRSSRRSRFLQRRLHIV